LLTGLYGPRVPLLLDAASFVFVLVAGLAVRTRRAVAPPSGTRQRGGLAIVRGNAMLRAVFGVFPLFVLLGSMVNVVDVFLVRSTLGASAMWYGLVGAVYSVGALGGAVGSARLRGTTGLAWALVISSVLLGVGMIGHGLTPTVGWLLPIAIASGAANGVLNVAVSALVMGTAAPAERGRVGALLTGVVSGTQLIAFGLGGALASALDPRAIFVLAGVASALPTLVVGRGILRAARAAEAADSTDMTAVPAAA
jgi:MFS family permease